jgi:hypothetical protein
MLAPLVATGLTREETRAEAEKQRRLLAFLFSTPAYWPSLELFGWRELGKRLRALSLEEKWDEMLPLMSDEMLEEFLPTAPYAEIGDLLRERYEGLASWITFPLPADPTHDPAVERVIARLHKRRPGSRTRLRIADRVG